MVKKILLAIAALTAGVTAQTYRRTGACPNFGCLFPPDQADFIAGQVFDIRIEIQAPFNGSEAYGGGVVNPNFSLTIEGGDGKAVEISDFYSVKQPAVDSYNFTYFEDLFARDNNSATLVNVLAQTYRHVTLYTPGTYTVVLNYNGGSKTVATWIVRPLSEATAKNVILFIGDGMTTAMVTAARLLGHKSINGKYQTKMALDGAPAFGMQTTHSLDSFITDSANSATALYAGKKSTVNALNVYTDSTGKPTDNPKFETVFEMFRRITGGMVGIVSTAYLADATPAAVVAHTSQRSASDIIVDQYLDGVTSAHPWTQWDGPDVLFGGGGSDFLPKNSNKNVSKLAKFQARGYDFVSDNTTLSKLGNTKRALGLFGKTTLPTWLDRNVYKQNLDNFASYNGTKGVYDTPGLKDMTLKAIDILASRSSTAGTGFMLMSEAASIDKAMHAADYERALGDLLELDQTVAATLQHLKDLGIYEETLVIVTADHGHGFDVFGGSDSAYMRNAKNDTQRRDSIGLYQSSGLSQYQVAPGSSAQNNTPVVGPQGPGFPNQWQPRYTAAFGMSSVVDHYENFITPNSSRLMSQLAPNSTTVYVANPTDSAGVGGFYIGGNLPVTSESGVHSLTDVPVYAWSAGCEAFRGVMNSPDIAFHIADALGLGRDYNATGAGAGKGNGKGNGNGNGNGKGKDILSSLPVRLPTI